MNLSPANKSLFILCFYKILHNKEVLLKGELDSNDKLLTFYFKMTLDFLLPQTAHLDDLHFPFWFLRLLCFHFNYFFYISSNKTALSYI